MCYVIQSGTRTWDDARALCSQLSGKLPVVGDDVTHKVITRLMRDEGVASIWLDARENITDWHWVSDGAVIGPQGCYNDRPWNHDLDLVTSIPDMTPDLCVSTCQTQGATYAAVQSKVECYCGATYGQYGLTATGGTWCSVPCPGDGSQYCGGWGKNSIYNVQGQYGIWSYKQPDSTNDVCAVLDTSGNDRKFADESCFRKRPFICDIPTSSCRPSDTGYYVRPGGCLYVGDLMPWWKAHGACAEKGGALLAVRNATQHDVIREILNGAGIDGAHWIGLTRAQWTWSGSDRAMSYTGWADMSPSGRRGRCLSVTSSSGFKWVDSRCTEQLNTVCVIASPSTTAQSTTSTRTPQHPTHTTHGAPEDTTTHTPTQLPNTMLESTHSESTPPSLTTEQTRQAAVTSPTAIDPASTTVQPVIMPKSTQEVIRSSATPQLTTVNSITPTKHETTFSDILETATKTASMPATDEQTAVAFIQTTTRESTNIPDILEETTLDIISGATSIATETPKDLTSENIVSTTMLPKYFSTEESQSTVTHSSTTVKTQTTDSPLSTSQTLTYDSVTTLPQQVDNTATTPSVFESTIAPFADATTGVMAIETNTTDERFLATSSEPAFSQGRESSTVLSMLLGDFNTSQSVPTTTASDLSDASMTSQTVDMTSQIEVVTSEPDELTTPGDVKNNQTYSDGILTTVVEILEGETTESSSVQYTGNDTTQLSTSSKTDMSYGDTTSSKLGYESSSTGSSAQLSLGTLHPGTSATIGSTESPSGEEVTYHSVTAGVTSDTNHESSSQVDDVNATIISPQETSYGPVNVTSMDVVNVTNSTDMALETRSISTVTDSNVAVTSDSTDISSITSTSNDINDVAVTSSMLDVTSSSNVTSAKSKTMTSELAATTEPPPLTTRETTTAAKTSPRPSTLTTARPIAITTFQTSIAILNTTSLPATTTQPVLKGGSNSRMSSVAPSGASSLTTKSLILSTLFAATQKAPTSRVPFNDVTIDDDVNMTSPGDINGSSGPDIGDKIEDGDAWSTFEIVVVAGLVALAFGLATSMVVFLSCKKKAGQCRSKSNKTDSAQTGAVENASPLGGATNVRVASTNGGIQNGGSHIMGAIGKADEQKRKKIEKYSLDDTAETKDLTTMEDIGGHIGDMNKGKRQQKNKRIGSIANGTAVTRERNGPGPPSTWSTLPKHYYGMDEYNGAYANGCYDNPMPDNVDMSQQAPYPVRQEVYFRMSQVFADSQQKGNSNIDPQHPGSGVSNPVTPDPTMTPQTPQICILDANGLYEASTYYDAYNPDQNNYSSTFPRYGVGNGTIGNFDQKVPDQGRLYEQAENNQNHYGPSHNYDRKKAGYVPPRTKLPNGVSNESAILRENSFNGSAVPFPSSPMSELSLPELGQPMHSGVQRTHSDAAMYTQHPSQTPSTKTMFPESSRNAPRSATVSFGSLRYKPRASDIIVPAPPRLPGAPPIANNNHRDPPAPPPRSSSRIDGSDTHPEPHSRLKQNGRHSKVHADGEGKRFYMMNAEEGITWC